MQTIVRLIIKMLTDEDNGLLMKIIARKLNLFQLERVTGLQ